MVTLARWTAWILVAVLVFVTLAPIDLRPVMTESANVERAAAYGLLGFLFTLAYPKHRVLALIAVAVVAGMLELGQLLTLTRHGRLPDFLVKTFAGAVGAVLAYGLLFVRGHRSEAPRG